MPAASKQSSGASALQRHDSPAARELPIIKGIRLLGGHSVLLQIDGAADVTITPEDRPGVLPAPKPAVFTLNWDKPDHHYQLPDHLAPVLEHACKWAGQGMPAINRPYCFLLSGERVGEQVELSFLHSDGFRTSELYPEVGAAFWHYDGSLVLLVSGEHVTAYDETVGVSYETREKVILALTQPDVLASVLALWGIDFQQPEDKA